jgi:predicted  nucleic acid-binding Zn-ribbon protein
MPHICTRCNNIFESGEDILKGCPSCGWKKFMFMRKMPRELDMSKHSEEQIITRAMGVKVPPRGQEKESVPPTKSEGAPENELSPGEGKPLESIKITAPGTYELNLPSLFERDELIMAVKEGTYFIDLTSAFKKGKKD